jgi:hypothetical protein
VRQQENESLEDFAHTVYVLVLDGYEKCEDDALEDIATEAFLRECKEKEAAIKVMEKKPVTLSKAIQFVYPPMRTKSLFPALSMFVFAYDCFPFP